MELTKNVPLLISLRGCKDIDLGILCHKHMLYTLGILAAYMLVNTLNGNYWVLYLRDLLGIQDGNVALYVTLRFMAMFLCSFFLVPRVKYQSVKKPMLLSLAAFAVSQILLLMTVGGTAGIVVLIASVFLEAAAVSVLALLTYSLVFIHAEEDQRALIVGMVYATVALIVSVFPALIGALAQISLRAPFYINLGLFALLAALSVAIS